MELALDGESASRVRCTTTDSAKGVEAAHVFLVFHPRPSNGDLGGIQRDKNRFYQASMRALGSVTYVVPFDAMDRMKTEDQEPLPNKSRSANFRNLAKEFWDHFWQIADARATNVQTWNWPWQAASWVPDSFWGDINDRLRLLDVESSRERQKLSLWQSLGCLAQSAEVRLPIGRYQQHVAGIVVAREAAASARDFCSESGADAGSDSDNSDCPITKLWSFEPDAISGHANWMALGISAPRAPRETLEWNAPLSCLKQASHFLVDCVNVHITGHSRFVLSWGFLCWPHYAHGWSGWPRWFEAAVESNKLQDLIIITTAKVLTAPEIFGDASNVEGLHMFRRLHKAGHQELAGTTLWWKACASNREDSVLLGNDHNLALAYVGGVVPSCLTRTRSF